jgi:hypothetical protein
LRGRGRRCACDEEAYEVLEEERTAARSTRKHRGPSARRETEESLPARERTSTRKNRKELHCSELDEWSHSTVLPAATRAVAAVAAGIHSLRSAHRTLLAREKSCRSRGRRRLKRRDSTGEKGSKSTSMRRGSPSRGRKGERVKGSGLIEMKRGRERGREVTAAVDGQGRGCRVDGGMNPRER